MRVLHVGIQASVHLARWIRLLEDQGWDQHLFGVNESTPSAELRDVTLHLLAVDPEPEVHPSVRVSRLQNWIDGPTRPELAAYSLGIDRAGVLARLIRQLQPDIVHSHEFQHGAYLTLEARSRLNARFPPWIAANWGSDIFWFAREPEHRTIIEQVLSACDYYNAECHRDLRLARDLGLRGRALPVLPVSGGLDVGQASALRQPGPTSRRRSVLLKGRSAWVGRGMIGLRAIERNLDVMRGHTLVLYQADADVRIAAETFCSGSGVGLHVIEHVPHDEMLRTQGRSRVSISLSMSDGICTSFVEAITMGAFPIQSNTGCADEWAKHGETALFVDPEDVDGVAAAIRRALTDDALVDRAAELNQSTAWSRLDLSRTRPIVVECYQKIAGGSR